MPRLIMVLSVAALLLSTSAASAQVKWYKHKSKKYKIQVCLNTGMKLKATRKGKWGVLSAKERGVKLLVMAYTGTLSFKTLQAVAVKVSKIPGRYWKSTRKSKAWHGFGRNATYLATGADSVAIAFLAKHGKYIDRNYVVLIGTSKANFKKKFKAFKAWGNCLAALP